MAHDDAGPAFGRRPAGAPTSFVCRQCELILDDGVDYLWCPRCSGEVRWIDLRTSRWRCDRCGDLRGVAHNVWPVCERCGDMMSEVPVAEPRVVVERPAGGRTMRSTARTVVIMMQLALLIVLALDPVGYAVVAPLALVALIAAVAFLILLYAGRAELIALARDHRTRVLHGLEHGCATLLERRGAEVIDGLTHEGLFILRIANPGRFPDDVVHRAASEATHRIAEGETSLAYHPRCGTSSLAAAAMISIVIAVATIAGFVAGIRPGAVMASVVIVAALLWLASRPLGLLAQRALTVSTRFAAAWVHRVTHTLDGSGRAIYVVKMTVRLVRGSLPAPGG